MPNGLKRKNNGFTLIELAVGLVILFLLAGLGFSLIRSASQKTKVAVAKTYIAQFAMVIDGIRNDCGFYPPSENGNLESLTSAGPPSPKFRGWQGPYFKTLPRDPWRNDYFYLIQNGLVFGPQECRRQQRGGPYDETFVFDSTATGNAGLIIENFLVASARVWLNGMEIFHPNQFNPQVSHLEAAVTLLARNSLRVWIPSNVQHSNYFLISVTSPLSRKASYILGSRGADKQPGGDGFAADLVWLPGQATGSFR
ncbi:MAG TPA: type II secretion system protein GspG [bacterium]|uniref:Type II secretion system protein G n=1 Tax=candidate division TA06 bacterium ADurb.Bin417 TaxID=1852828 RepID=A0A1V5MHF2_UNCT6|nr:MAG: Type II secretion system protein G precursor [candidate division TA06 bacterium ADurb.Bin417]HNQ34658.1 type II secretion system protein GspG [bacterium]HNS48916.1 type II secretion system protein GspG [bacterium]